MNDQGQIKEFKNAEEAQASGFNIPLTHEEAEEIESFPEVDRKIALMWVRFWQHQRKTRKLSERPGMRHAFITGCRLMLAELNKE